MSFLALSYAWWALLAAPLVALYFLKLKRQRQTVPSLVLWSAVIQDQRVNSPFQRFRNHLQLWLQLLALLLVVLALMQPVFGGGSGSSSRIAHVVDVSASMGAREIQGGPTRLEVVKERLREVVATLPRGSEICLVAADHGARRLTPFTDNPRLLQAAIDDLQPTDVAGDVAPALRLVHGLAQAERIDRLVLHSDGVLPARVDAELALPFTYDRVPPGGANAGIATVRARFGGDRRWELLVAVAASGVEPMSGRLVVRNEVGDELLRHPVRVAPGDRVRLLLKLGAGGGGLMELALETDGADTLAADDRAWLRLPAVRPLAVFVDDGLPHWASAVQVTPETVLVDRAETADIAVVRDADRARQAPLRILDGTLPARLAGLVQRGDDGSSVVDWRSADPLLRHVVWTDLAILDSLRWAPGADVAAVEDAGYRVLVDGDAGPLLLAGGEAGRRELVFAFASGRSTLPYRVGFPVLVANAVAQVRADLGLAEAEGLRTGAPSIYGLPEAGAWAITAPDGSQQTAVADDRGRIPGVSAPLAGVYTLRLGSAERQVGAGVLDATESSFVVAEELELGEATIAAAAAELDQERPLWPWLALLATVVLCSEWWLVQRRPGGWS